MTENIKCPQCSFENQKDIQFCGKCGFDLETDTKNSTKKDPLIGSLVEGRFLVKEKLGEGGMGIVYLAEQTSVKRPIALKVLHPYLTQDENLYARFQNEAEAASRLTHPNTVTVFDFGKTSSGSLFIAMEFIKGKSLDDEIAESGPFSCERAVFIASQICGSLQDAHDNNIVHRDLKPENIILHSRGNEKDIVKVLDFGIAKIIEDDGTDRRKALTKTGMVFGTPQYMSPEQIRGETVDSRTDVYSLGIIMYEMLCGAIPFSAKTSMGLLTKHLLDEPPPLVEKNPNLNISPSINNAVLKAIEKSPQKRPSSMNDLLDLLLDSKNISGIKPKVAPKINLKENSSFQTAPTQAISTSLNTLESSAVKKNKLLPIIVIFIVVLSAGFAAWHFLYNSAPESKQKNITKLEVKNIPQLPDIQKHMAYDTSATLNDKLPDSDAGVSTKGEDEDKKLKATKPETIAAIKRSDNKEVKDKEVKDKAVKDKDKKDEPTPSEKINDVSCLVGSTRDPIARSMVLNIKKNQKSIKDCVRKNEGESKLYIEFSVPAGSSNPQGIRRMRGLKGSAAECVIKNINKPLSAQKEKRTGTITFTFSVEKKSVKLCKAKVAARIIPSEMDRLKSSNTTKVKAGTSSRNR